MVEYCMNQIHSNNEHEWDRCLQEETCKKNVVKSHDFQESSTVQTKCVILAKHWLAPWWWFPCKPKHVGAAFLILICFNKFYVCISWTIKGLKAVLYLAWQWKHMEKNKFNLNKLNFAEYWIPLLFTVFCIKGKAIPIQAWTGQKVPGGWGSQIWRQSAHEDGMVVSPTYHFC